LQEFCYESSDEPPPITSGRDVAHIAEEGLAYGDDYHFKDADAHNVEQFSNVEAAEIMGMQYVAHFDD
jgi:hypothetical protein